MIFSNINPQIDDFSIINHPFWGSPIYGKLHVIPSYSQFVWGKGTRGAALELVALGCALRRTLFSKQNLAKVASGQSTRVEQERTVGCLESLLTAKGGTDHGKWYCLAPCHTAGTSNGFWCYIANTYIHTCMCA